MYTLNATQLADVFIAACGQGQGGNCVQNSVSGITTCSGCGFPDTRDANTGACVDTSRCVTYPWCSSSEAHNVVVPTHNRFVRLSFFGPYALNFTYPYTNLTALAQFVPLLAPNTTVAALLLNTYVAARIALGGGGADTTEYFDDGVSNWGSSLKVYLSVLPPSYGASYIQVLKKRLCAQTWQPSQGTCVVPF